MFDGSPINVNKMEFIVLCINIIFYTSGIQQLCVADLEDSQHKPPKNSSSLIYNASNGVGKRSSACTGGRSQRGEECGKEGVRERMREE